MPDSHGFVEVVTGGATADQTSRHSAHKHAAHTRSGQPTAAARSLQAVDESARDKQQRRPFTLRELDNVVLLPHVGSATARTREAMALLTRRNLDSYLSTGQLVTPVLPPRR